MKNLEEGFEIAYFTFLNGLPPAHIRVRDVQNRSAPTGKKAWPMRDLKNIETNREFSSQDIDCPGVSFPDIQFNYHGVTPEDHAAFANSVVSHRAAPVPSAGEQTPPAAAIDDDDEDEDKDTIITATSTTTTPTSTNRKTASRAEEGHNKKKVKRSKMKRKRGLSNRDEHESGNNADEAESREESTYTKQTKKKRGEARDKRRDAGAKKLKDQKAKTRSKKREL